MTPSDSSSDWRMQRSLEEMMDAFQRRQFPMGMVVPYDMRGDGGWGS